MRTKVFAAVAASFACAGALAVVPPARAQTAEVKEKPPMYTYVSSFAFPRAKWADAVKDAAGAHKVFDKAFSSGKLVAWGDDTILVHSSDGYTHDSFWSGTSMAAVLEVLEDLAQGGGSTTPTLASATKHEDGLFVSRYYNWKPGTFKGAYTFEGSYRLKDNAPDNAIDIISKSFGVPLLEKLLADGTILEYEIDEEQIHTEAPGRFWVIYIAKSAEGLDKARAALGEAFKSNPLIGAALDSMVDPSKHHDYLAKTDGVYK